MPLLFPDDLDDDFVEGTFAAEWANFSHELAVLRAEAAEAIVVPVVKTIDKALGVLIKALLRASR